MTNEIIEIGPTEIAKLLSPLKEETPMLFRGALVERVERELGIGNSTAASVVDYLNAAKYLATMDLDESSMHPIYTIAPKGRELIRKHL